MSHSGFRLIHTSDALVPDIVPIYLVVLRHDCLAVAGVVLGEDGVAGGADADDPDEEALDVSEYAVEGHSGTAAFGLIRNSVRKPWAAATRVTWWCQPAHLRPS